MAMSFVVGFNLSTIKILNLNASSKGQLFWPL